MRFRLAVLLWLFGIVALPAAAQDPDPPVTFDGIVTSLSNSGRSIGGPGYFSQLNRVRAGVSTASWKGLSVRVESDIESVAGSFLDVPEFDFFRREPPEGAVLSDGNDFFARYRLYRGYLQYEKDRLHVRAGRQRVSIGVGRLWSPLDLINPYNPLRIEKDLRPGADGFLVEIRQNALSQVAAAWLPSRASGHSSLLGRYVTNVSELDLQFMGGDIRGEHVGGFAAEKSFSAGAVRGEFTYTGAEQRENYWRLAVGSTYSRPDLDLTFEYYRNGKFTGLPTIPEVLPPGVDLTQLPFSSGPLLLDPLNLSRHNFGAFALWDVTSLLRSNTVAIYAVSDRGVVFNPELTYSLRQDLDLTGGAMLVSGRKDSIFDRVGNVAFVRVQWFFGGKPAATN